MVAEIECEVVAIRFWNFPLRLVLMGLAFAEIPTRGKH